MNAPRFSVHVDQDALAEQDLAAALSRSVPPGDEPGHLDQATGSDSGHHGARDGRQAARGRSDKAHARTGGGKARSYAFRRS